MFLYHLTNELARRGHEVTVVHCVDSFEVLTKAPPRGDFRTRRESPSSAPRTCSGPLSPLVTYLAGTPGLKAPELRASVRALALRRRPLPPRDARRRPRRSRYGDGVKLYTTHDHWLVCPMYDLWRYNRELCEQPDCMRCSLSFKRPPQLWRYTDCSSAHLDNIDLFLVAEQIHDRAAPAARLHVSDAAPPYFLPAHEAIDRDGAPARGAARAALLPLRRPAREAQGRRTRSSTRSGATPTPTCSSPATASTATTLRSRAAGSITCASSAESIRPSCASSTPAPSRCSFRRSCYETFGLIGSRRSRSARR